MPKIKENKLPITEEEFERQFVEAEKRGRQRMETEPSATAARYDKRTGRIRIELNNGCTFMFPPDVAQGLRGASEEDLAVVEVMPTGYAVRWKKLDADFTIAGLLQGIFGTRAWMKEIGRQGGRRTTEAKANAARANGRKGGRPRERKSEKKEAA